jgi:hypothetical protein
MNVGLLKQKNGDTNKYPLQCYALQRVDETGSDPLH